MKSKSVDSQLSIVILNVFESTSNQKLWRNEIFIFVKFTCFLHIEKKMYIKGFMNHVVTVLKNMSFELRVKMYQNGLSECSTNFIFETHGMSALIWRVEQHFCTRSLEVIFQNVT